MPQPLVSQAGLPLRQLVPEAQIFGHSELQVRRWVKDARQVRPGDVWVALPPEKKTLSTQANRASADQAEPPAPIPPKDLALALAQGAAAVLAQSPPNEEIPVPLILVPDVHEAWGRICHALAGYPSKTLKVIAVTGRSGTTATCWLLKEVLAQAGYRPALLSPLGYFHATTWKSPPQGINTPEGLANQLARMLQQQSTHALLELSPEDLSNRRLVGTELDVVCLCPFGLPRSQYQSSHATPQSFPLDPCGQPRSRDGWQETPPKENCWTPALRAGLFRYVKPQGLRVLSADDPVSAACLPILEGAVLTVGRRQMAELTARLVEAQLAEQTFLLQAGADVVPVRTRRIGNEHITSCLLAAAVGLAYGIELLQVVRALESVQTVPAQLERIERGQPFGLFLQQLRSAAELRASLQTLRRLCQGQLWCVAGLPPQPQKKSFLLAQGLLRYVDRLVLTADDPAAPSSLRQQTAWAKPILSLFAPPKEVRWLPDRGEAIFTALQQAQPGDCLLILTRMGKTYPTGQNHNAVWDDRAVVQTCLEHLYPEELPLQ